MIVLINDLVVDVTEFNYTLMVDRHKTDKKGKPIYTTLGYYSNLAGAVNGAKEYCIKNELRDGLYDLREAIEKINSISTKFSNLLLSEIKGCD